VVDLPRVLRFNFGIWDKTPQKESRSGGWRVIIHVGFSMGSVFHQNQIGGSAEYEGLTVGQDLTWADIPVRVHEFHVGPLLYHRKEVMFYIRERKREYLCVTLLIIWHIFLRGIWHVRAPSRIIGVGDG